MLIPLLAFITAPGRTFAAPAGAAPEDMLSPDTLSIEIALMRKAEADELFLTGDRQSARTAYCSAAQEVRPQRLTLTPAQEKTRALLDADIRYRLLLLDHDLGFWGGVQTLRPQLPGAHLRRMKELLDEFDRTAKEIDALVERAKDRDRGSSEANILANRMFGESKQQLSINKKLDTLKEFKRQKEDRLSGRLETLREQRLVLESQVGAATAQARQAAADFNTIVTDALIESTGVPPEMARSIQSGNLSRAALGAASAQLVNSPRFQATLADVNANLGAVAGYIRQGQALQADIAEKKAVFEEYRNTLTQAANALRNPTIASMAQLGGQLYPGLTKAARDSWTRNVQNAKSVVALAEMIDAVDDPTLSGKLREATVGYLMKARDEAAQELRDAAMDHVAQLPDPAAVSAFYTDVLRRAAAAATTAESRRRVIDEIMRASPSQFVAMLPAPVVAALVRNFRYASRQELVDRLSATGLALLAQQVRITVDDIAILDHAGGVVVVRIGFPKLVGLAGAPLDSGIAHLKSESRRMLRNLEGGGAQLRQVVLNAIPGEALVRGVRKMAPQPGIQGSEGWDTVMNALSDADRTAAIRQIVTAQVGAAYARQTHVDAAGAADREARRYLQPPAVPGADSTSAGDRQADKLAEQALATAFPGATIGLKVVASFSAFNEAVGRAQHVAAQLQQNLVEELHLVDLRDQIRLTQVLSNRDAEVATLAYESAMQQHEGYTARIADFGADAIEARGAAALRRSLYFYIAEQLRRSFDLLNEAVALWSSGGPLSARILASPQNIRLALDADIHLYDWLDRGGESSRSDVDGLLIHWRQLYMLAATQCFIIGCEKNSHSTAKNSHSTAGKFGETDAIRLSLLVPASDQRRFSEWQKSRSKSAISFSIPVIPGKFPFGWKTPLFGPHAENVRVLDVRLGRYWGSGVPTQLNNIRLEHPGPGHVVRDGRIERVTYLPDNETVLEPQNRFEREDLERRKHGEAAPGYLGYPFYTAWQLTFYPSEENHRVPLGEVQIRFGLHYNDPTVNTTENQFVRSLEEIDAALGAGAPPELGESELFSYQVQWRNVDRKPRGRLNGVDTAFQVPASGAVPLDPSMVRMLYRPRPVAQGCGTAPGAAEGERAKTGSRSIDVVRVCRPDAEIRRNLLSAYTSRLAPGESRAQARHAAQAKFRELKQGVCASSVDLPRRGP